MSTIRKERAVYNLLEPTRVICAACKCTFNPQAINLEQWIISDTDFCPTCFNDFLDNTDYEGDATNLIGVEA